MKKLSYALAAAATLLSFGTFGTAAQATPFGHRVHTQVYVVPGPPPPHHYRGPDRRYYAPPPPPRHYRHDRRWDDRRHGGYRRDRDGDGVPNRYDRAPNNPYRR